MRVVSARSYATNSLFGRSGFFTGAKLLGLKSDPLKRAESFSRTAIVAEAVPAAVVEEARATGAKLGTVVHGFELVREELIEEIATQAQLWRHVKTGGELLSLVNKDENKVFGACFRTPVSDSTGVPHILEHSVLCGSRKYPVKEPFVELMKGSLQTYLNAFTYPDKTCYPVASCNDQDFRNLVDVYLDAVFHPRLSPAILQQEGWHYEIEKAEEPLTFKGVVFNEMKGVYSSPDSILSSDSMRLLFPDTTYSFESGGDPRSTSVSNIPNLTWEQFENFHKTYYHPSNSRLFFYGDFDPTERLKILNDYLSEFDRIEPNSAVSLQPRWSEARRVERVYDSGSEAEGQEKESDKKTMVTVNWLVEENNRPELTLSMDILSYILLGTPASPLRKALIDSGLGEDITGGGLETELRQMYFSAGLKGIAYDKVQEVEELIGTTLQRLSSEGIEQGMVEAALNTIEFQLRENNTGSFPRGISLMLRSLATWLYGGDPYAPLKYEAPLLHIKTELAKPSSKYFENLIKEYFLDNTHRLTVVLKPDASVGQKQDEAEKARLAKAKEALGEQGVEDAVRITKDLKAKQEALDTPEDLAKIPTLSLKDIDERIKLVPTELFDPSDDLPGTVLLHPLFTNDIAYVDFAFDLSEIPRELLQYVPLFTRSLLNMGTSKLDFVQLTQRIGQKTGGIRASTFTSAPSRADDNVKGQQMWLFVRGKAMPHQTEDLLAIVREVITDVNLDDKNRFKQLVLEAKAGLESRLVPGGHMLVAQRLSSIYSAADWASEQMGGLSYLFFLRSLVNDIDANWEDIHDKLKQIQRIIVNRHGITMNVTVDPVNFKTLAPHIDTFYADLPIADPIGTPKWLPESLSTGNEAFVIPAQVNYVGKGANLYDLGYKLKGSSMVVTNFLSTGHLWNTVRVQGGAYGGFCRFDPRSGVFNFLSYRDPNLMETLGNYDAASAYLKSVDLSRAQLTQAILGTIGDLDAYQLPDAKGFSELIRLLVGETEWHRQTMRADVLETSVQDMRDFADVLHEVANKGSVVVVGGQDAIDKANLANADFLTVTRL